MPWGAVATAGAVLVGGFLGVRFGHKVKKETGDRLIALFGVIGLTFGVTGVVKVVHLPAVVLSVILGTITGEIVDMEKLLAKLGAMLEKITGKVFKGKGENSRYDSALMVSILVMFCFTGTGIYGAMYAGMSGDNSLLFSKAMTDLVVSGLFGVTVGYVMMAVALPQFAFFAMLYYLAKLVLPFVTESMIMDFTACGGILMLATGLRMAKIKDYHVGNMLPAFLWVFPLSALWSIIAG